MPDEETNRVLRELSGTASTILERINALGDRFDEHVKTDQASFNAIRGETTALRDGMNSAMEESAASRNLRLDAQDKTLDDIKTMVDRAKGAWWLIGILSAITVFAVGVGLSIWKLLQK